MFSRFGWLCACVAACFAYRVSAQPPAQSVPTAQQLLAASKYVTDRVRQEADADSGRSRPSPDDPVISQAPAPDAPGAGACVTLRLHGHELTRAISMDAAASLRSAADQAIVSARAAMPEPRDMLQRAARAEQWKSATASIELAGPLVEVDLATFADAGGRVMTGIEGVAVRMGDRVEATFPAQMLVANDTPPTAFLSLVSRITGDPTLAMPGVPAHDAGDLAKSHSLRFYKFRVVHAAQAAPGAAALPLTRGGRIVMSRDITMASMREFAQHLSDNILAQRTTADGRDELFSAYWPLQDRAAEVAGPREKALACLALCESARLTHTPGADATLPPPVAAAQELLIPLLSIDGRLPADDLPPATAAMLVVSMSELCTWTGKPKGDWFDKTHARLAQAVQSSVDESGAWNDTTRVPERSIIALALVQLATDPVMGTGNRASPAAQSSLTRADAAIRALFRDTAPGALVMHMPWLARAEFLLANDDPIKSAAALRQMRDTAWSMQVGDAEARLAGNDLEGGLMLAGAGGDTTPTAQSARPFAFFAQALGDQRLTDKSELPAQTSRMLRALRFLRQLSLDTNWDWCLPNQQQAHWGVRTSVTDQRQSLDATSMTLITVSSALRSLESPPPAPPPRE